MLLAPCLNRLFDRAAERAPNGSVWQAVLLELSNNYSTTLIRSRSQSGSGRRSST